MSSGSVFSHLPQNPVGEIVLDALLPLGTRPARTAPKDALVLGVVASGNGVPFGVGGAILVLGAGNRAGTRGLAAHPSLGPARFCRNLAGFPGLEADSVRITSRQSGEHKNQNDVSHDLGLLHRDPSNFPGRPAYSCRT